MLCGPAAGVVDGECVIAVRLQHFGPNDHGGCTGQASKTDRQFRVPLADAQATVGFPAHWNVTWGAEFLPEKRHGLLGGGFGLKTGLGKFCEPPGGQRTVVVGDARVRLSVVQGEREGGPGIVTQIVGHEVVEDRVPLNGIGGRVKVLEKGETKAFAHFVADRKEEQTPAILSELPHGGGCCRCGRKQEVRFAFPFFGIEQANGTAVLERTDRFLNTGFHGLPCCLTFMKSRILSFVKTTLRRS